MKNYGRTTVHEFLDDFVVYRNLVPVDDRLPPLSEISRHIDVPTGIIPRKSQPDYARAMAYLLQRARELDAPGTGIERLVYVGDTQLNDGTAFVNICHAGGWPGLAFIGSENDAPAEVELIEAETGTLYLANRWSALGDFSAYCDAHGVPLDEQTAVIIDLDKTALGARGRNDHVINEARVAAVRRTVDTLLGDEFDPEGFQIAYDRLNQVEFHPFTTDNQDYLAYICLILGSGLYSLEPLVDDIRQERLASFEEFITQIDERADELPANLRRIHGEVYARVRENDPTPFKTFRYNEYHTTVGRMGQLDDTTSIPQLVAEEILITAEVREIALAWRTAGALLFGLSDKPDEASLPTEALAAEGYQPIHRTETHVVGT